MDQRVIAERGTIAFVCVVLPTIAGLSLVGQESGLSGFVLRWLSLAIPGAPLAYLGLMAAIRYWLLNFAPIPHRADDAEMIAEAAREYARNQAAERLLEKARKAAHNQDGRAVALYINYRIDDQRRRKLIDSRTDPASLPSLQARLGWALTLLLSTTIILVLLPDAWQLTEIGAGFAFLVALAIPIWATAVRIAVFGEKDAAGWLLRRRQAPADEAEQAQGPKVKLRKVSPKSSRPWHTRGTDSSIPLYRTLLLSLLVIAAALYMLREYGPRPSLADYEPPVVASVAPAVGDPGPAPDESQADEAADDEPVYTPPPTPPTPPPAMTASRRTAPATPPYWRELSRGGSQVFVNADRLGASARDLEQLQSVFAVARPRLESLYRERLIEKRGLAGRIAIELVIQPHGWVSESSVVHTEIEDDAFIAGMRDRLDALNFGGGGAQPIRVVYSVHFLP